MEKKFRLELILKDKESKVEERLNLYGRSIGFGRIMDNLIKFRGLFIGYYEEEPFVREIKYFKEQNVPESKFIAEIFLDNSLINTKRDYVASHSIPKIEILTFRNTTEKLLKRSSEIEKLSQKILSDVDLRYSYKEWRGLMPLNGAIDILFNKYQNHLR